jgi:SAM-dependent methyltransferase
MLIITVAILMLILAAIFCHAMFIGAPYLPARQRYVEQSLDMLGLQPGQTLLELGSGDGRVLLAAARRGLHAVGYEINPLLFAYSWLRTRHYRNQVRIIYGNYWQQPLPPADGIYVFLLQQYMPKLDAKLKSELKQPAKLLSFAFYIPGKRPIKEAEGIYLYQY